LATWYAVFNCGSELASGVDRSGPKRQLIPCCLQTFTPEMLGSSHPN
jgi:hypothetical protein